MSTQIQAVIIRFFKAFAAGFFGGAGMITISNIHYWTDLQTALQAVALSGVTGGIVAVILAGEKYFNWTDNQ